MSMTVETRVPCSKDTRDRLRAAKRGGDTYDDLLCKMLDQYNPDVAYEG